MGTTYVATVQADSLSPQDEEKILQSNTIISYQRHDVSNTYQVEVAAKTIHQAFDFLDDLFHGTITALQ